LVLREAGLRHISTASTSMTSQTRSTDRVLCESSPAWLVRWSRWSVNSSRLWTKPLARRPTGSRVIR